MSAVASLPEETRAYLAHPSLAPVWQAVRVKLERSRLAATGSVTVTVDEISADRLRGLLKTPVHAGTVKLRLSRLDEALRASAAQTGLVLVTEALTGKPLVDRAAARDRDRAAWSEVWSILDAAFAGAGQADAAWVPDFVAGLRRSGLLTRAGAAAAAAAVADFAAVLSVLAEAGALATAASRTPAEPRFELAELASRCTGDAHRLDDGQLAGTLVLRAAAAALGVEPPEQAAARRDLWGRLGVIPDVLSGTVLVWGLRPPGRDAWSAMMRVRTDLGVATHLTLHELRGPAASAALSAEETVSVCENPQVLQAAARAGVAAPLVCPAGNPSGAGWLLLRRLVADGARLRYHGDFDWPGVAIATRVLALGAAPWRMSAADYADAVATLPPQRRLPLAGTRSATPWDRQLAAAMARTGVSVHEEALLPVLLADLRATRDDGRPPV